MNRRNKLKVVHFLSTGWFIICAVYLITIALLQAGRSWWFIASLSGHSVAMVFVLINLYLFSIFRGIGRDQRFIEEHPLSNSVYYAFFYVSCPFLGTLTGAISAIGVSGAEHFLLITAGGVLWTTFLVWIIVDPIVGLLEMLLPTSRAHRKERLLAAREKRKEERMRKERILAELDFTENLKREEREKKLFPYAKQLAELLASNEVFDIKVQNKAVDIGMTAWQMGGIECMKQLHSMAIKEYLGRGYSSNVIDHITIWWDGVGRWQSGWYDGESEPVLGEKMILCEV